MGRIHGLGIPCAQLLAEEDTRAAHAQLRRLVAEIALAWESGRLAKATAELHRRLVELSGNATRGMVAGMLHEISEHHTTAAILGEQNLVPKAQYSKLVRSDGRLVELVEAAKV
jgi:GntR family transcriptional regulator, transcriptional repressor for pyruvate dehydrogenase complex